MLEGQSTVQTEGNTHRMENEDTEINIQILKAVTVQCSVNGLVKKFHFISWINIKSTRWGSNILLVQ